MTVADWLEAARADAERRGIPELAPLLAALARSTQTLRDADREFAHPGAVRQAALSQADATPTE